MLKFISQIIQSTLIKPHTFDGKRAVSVIGTAIIVTFGWVRAHANISNDFASRLLYIWYMDQHWPNKLNFLNNRKNGVTGHIQTHT